MPTGREIRNGLSLVLLAVGMVELSKAAFPWKTRRRILRRDGYVSAESGEESEELEAAHYNHDKRNPDINRTDNGRALTPAEHYADHFNRHGTNGLGLSEEDNLWALRSIWTRLSPQDRANLPEPEEVGQAFIPRKVRKDD